MIGVYRSVPFLPIRTNLAVLMNEHIRSHDVPNKVVNICSGHLTIQYSYFVFVLA